MRVFPTGIICASVIALTFAALALTSCAPASEGFGPPPPPPPPPPGDSLVVAFSSYLGGNQEEMARDVAVDPAGNIYVAGGAKSPNFPTTAGAFDQSFNSSGNFLSDAFVTKYSSTGQLLWSTLLGGPNFDRVYGMEVDDQGFVYVAGRAGSGFPVTAGALQTTFAGGNQVASEYGPEDGFVCKLKPDGTGIVFCTYFGDDDYAPIRDLAVDANHDIYIVTSDSTGNFPTAWFTNAYQKQIRGGRDALIAKISADGSQVLWATYLGGSDNEGNTNSIYVDGTGVYVDMFTRSTDMPTPGGFDHVLGGQSDVYAAKLSLDGTSLIYGTYVGGSGTDDTETHQLAIDGQGDAYVVSATHSTDFPTTPGAYQPRFGGGGRDAFVAKIGPTGALLAATYVGGSGDDGGEGVAVDASGNVYFSGETNSVDFPINIGAGPRGGYDAFAVKLSSDLSRELYGARYGGTQDDRGRGAALGANRAFYIVGQTDSPDWSLTSAAQASNGGSTDGFIVGLNPLH